MGWMLKAACTRFTPASPSLLRCSVRPAHTGPRLSELPTGPVRCLSSVLLPLATVSCVDVEVDVAFLTGVTL
jgi:hypothetical protein